MFVMDELADAATQSGHDVIKMTIGIAELPVPEPVRRVFSRKVDDLESTRLVYPQGLPELRAAVSDYYREHFKAPSDPEQVIINVGTSAIFRNIFQVTCRPGQKILLPRPYYCLYLLSAILAGGEVTYYDIDPETMRLDIDSFRKAYTPDDTAVVVLNSPGNPLGNILTRDEVEAINDIVAGRSFIVHDEIYNNVVFDGDYLCPLSYIDRHRDTHIVTNSFSKGFRMYTKRVGYAILPDPLIMPLRIVQQHTLLTCDPVTQMGMIEALKDTDSPKELTAVYAARARYTVSQLNGTGCRPLEPKGGFYAVLNCEDWIRRHGMTDSKDLARDILQKVHVSTVPGTDFGYPHGLRLSFCQSRYNEGIDRLRDYFTASDRAGSSQTFRAVPATSDAV